MSRTDISRLEALQVLGQRGVTQADIARRLDLSERQVRRLQRRYEAEGAAGLISRKRGRPSNNALDPQLLAYAIELVRERYADFGPTFANEKLRELHAITIGTESLRQAMIRAELWTAKRLRRKRIHPPRERRAQFGELVQIDGSPHAWFEDRAPRCTLIVFIDDATSRLLSLHFSPTETTWAYFHALRLALERHGRPLAFYSDKHSIFRVPSTLQTSGETQFGRAAHELDIQLLCANSPQAKGRVERVNQTLQARLTRELRLQRINDIGAANMFLPEYIARHNERFASAASSDIDAHRSIQSFDLDSIVAMRYNKRLSKDCLLQLHRQIYLVDDPSALPRQEVSITEHESGAITFASSDGKTLTGRRLRSLSEQAQIQTAKDLTAPLPRPPQRRPGHTPAPNHPWRRFAVSPRAGA